MRFVEIKSTDQQACRTIHRTRDLAVRQRTAIVNMIRSILRKFGHIPPNDIEAVIHFARKFLAGDRSDMPDVALGVMGTLCDQLLALNQRIDGYTKLIGQHAFIDKRCKRLAKIPEVGPITASAIVATIGDGDQFRSGGDLATWLGLTHLNKSSGSRERLGRITKKGDQYLHKLLVVGMTARALQTRNRPERTDYWTAKTLADKPFRLATTALANNEPLAQRQWRLPVSFGLYLQCRSHPHTTFTGSYHIA